MRRATKTTPPMTPPTTALVFIRESPTATAPLPVEVALELEETDDMLLLVVEAGVDVPREDVEVDVLD